MTHKHNDTSAGPVYHVPGSERHGQRDLCQHMHVLLTDNIPAIAPIKHVEQGAERSQFLRLKLLAGP